MKYIPTLKKISEEELENTEGMIVITGRHVLKAVCVISLISHALFISYQLIQNNTIGHSYWTVSTVGISAMLLSFILTTKKKK